MSVIIIEKLAQVKAEAEQKSVGAFVKPENDDQRSQRESVFAPSSARRNWDLNSGYRNRRKIKLIDSLAQHSKPGKHTTTIQTKSRKERTDGESSDSDSSSETTRSRIRMGKISAKPFDSEDSDSETERKERTTSAKGKPEDSVRDMSKIEDQMNKVTLVAPGVFVNRRGDRVTPIDTRKKG